MELHKGTSVRHHGRPEWVAAALVEDQEGAGRIQHSCHNWPRDQKYKSVEVGDSTAHSLRMLEFSVMEPWVFKLALCRILIKKHRFDEMHEANR